MIEQLKTIQTGLAIAIDAEGFVDKPVRRALLDAVKAAAQLEAMVGEQEPKFWYRPVGNDGLYEGPVHNNSIGGKMLRDEKPGEWVPLFEGAAPVAQQPQAEPTDSMGIPLSCGKPLCSPGDHHPLCKLHKKPQAEAVEAHRCTGAGDTAFGAKADCQFCAAPQQAEAVPSDVTDAMVVAGARALCNRFADTGGVSREDQWNIYAEDFKDDARAVLNAAIAQQKGASHE